MWGGRLKVRLGEPQKAPQSELHLLRHEQEHQRRQGVLGKEAARAKPGGQVQVYNSPLSTLPAAGTLSSSVSLACASQALDLKSH